MEIISQYKETVPKYIKCFFGKIKAIFFAFQIFLKKFIRNSINQEIIWKFVVFNDMSQPIQTYLIKFPSSKVVGPFEKGPKKQPNLNFSELSLLQPDQKEAKEDVSINEHLNQNDKNTFSSKIGFMTKKNLSFHSKFENPNDIKERKTIGSVTVPSMSQQSNLQIDKLLKKIEILEEENTNLLRINNFSDVILEENRRLKRQLEQNSKEMDDKVHTIDTLSNEITVIKEKYENEYFNDKKEKYNKLKKKEGSLQSSLKLHELMNDNKNLSLVVKEISEKYNRIMANFTDIEAEKQILEVKLRQANKEKQDFKERLTAILPNSQAKNPQWEDCMSFEEILNQLNECFKGNSENNYLLIPPSSCKKKVSENSYNSHSEENYYTNNNKTPNKPEIMRERNTNTNEMGSNLKSNEKNGGKDSKKLKIKTAYKENCFLKRPPSTTNNSEYVTNLKIYRKKK